jgi:hypothetical protein
MSLATVRSSGDELGSKRWYMCENPFAGPAPDFLGLGARVVGGQRGGRGSGVQAPRSSARRTSVACEASATHLSPLVAARPARIDSAMLTAGGPRADGHRTRADARDHADQRTFRSPGLWNSKPDVSAARTAPAMRSRSCRYGAMGTPPVKHHHWFAAPCGTLEGDAALRVSLFWAA